MFSQSHPQHFLILHGPFGCYFKKLHLISYYSLIHAMAVRTRASEHKQWESLGVFGVMVIWPVTCCNNHAVLEQKFDVLFKLLIRL